MKARILVIEDVREMADLIALYLGGEGMEVDSCPTGEEGLERFRANRFDLVVLDINLPGMDGFELLQHLRRESAVPVVIVSARDADEDMVLGLGIGADEFVTKPFSPKVLAARVRALLRRTRDLSAPLPEVVRFGDFALDREGYVLKHGEQRVGLSSREFEVLAYLVEHAGKPQSPDEIYAGVWQNQFGDLTAVGVYIQRLRRKIEDDPANPKYIQTVHGRGYRFNEQTIRPGGRAPVA
jgi:DNA-binding response OmpR family regulator